jgi:hypothetical protein
MRHVLTVAAAAAVLGLGVVAAPVLAQRNAPFAPHAGGGMNSHPAAKDPAVEKLVAKAQKLEKQLKAKPKDAKLKIQTAEVWYQAGHGQEYSKANLSPRTRYRVALTYYRKALALNPAHKKAAAEKKQIEDIYKSMGMGIPK